MAKGSTKTQTTADVPEYLETAYQEMVDRGRALADTPFTPYTGQMVAGFSPDQIQGQADVRNLANQTAGFNPANLYMNLASQAGQDIGLFQNLGGTQIGDVASPLAASLLDTDMSAYQNPFQQAVIDASLVDIDRRRDQAVQRAQDRAINAGAFGGSRSAILEGEATRPFEEEALRTITGLRQQGFDTAQQAALSDVDRLQQANLLASQQEQQRALAQADLNQAYGGQFGDFLNRTRGLQRNLIGDVANLQGINLSNLLTSGAGQQALNQAILDAQRAEFDREQADPLMRFGLFQQGAMGVPTSVIGQTSTQRQTAGIGDILRTGASLLGGAMSGGLLPAIGATASTAIPAATGGKGGMGMGGGKT